MWLELQVENWNKHGHDKDTQKQRISNPIEAVHLVF